jgi:hypothetical protein
MSDIGKRFREEAGLTRELGNPFRPSPGKYGHYEAYEDGKTTQLKSSQAQLNKALSTKLDNGRYVLALIDTKGELPRVLYERYEPGFHERVEYIVAKKTQEDMLKEGYKKVVHVFGEKE